MVFKRFIGLAPVQRSFIAIVLVALTGLLGACSGSSRPKPPELPANSASLKIQQAWQFKLPRVDFGLQAAVGGDIVTVAAGDGTVIAIDARAGTELWRAQAGGEISAGVGTDGTIAAVVTRKNELVVIEAGKVLWRQHLPAEAFTAPLVAGRRVFVQTADRSTSAWDAQTGRRLWQQTRPVSDALVLRQPGVLFPVGNTLVAGVGARLVGMNPNNGSTQWETAVASPRGTNDVERLVDLVAPVSRTGSNVCLRAYNAVVACVDAVRGTVAWSEPAAGGQGVASDERAVYGAELNGVVNAWQRSSGTRLWSSDDLRLRTLTAPLAVGRTLVLGEDTGTVHFLSRQDGTVLNRLVPDGSAIAAVPVLAANTVVIVTRNGGVFGLRPE